VVYLYLDTLRKKLAWKHSNYGKRPGLLVPGGIAER
jgi:hypothetical protein